MPKFNTPFNYQNQKQSPFKTNVLSAIPIPIVILHVVTQYKPKRKL